MKTQTHEHTLNAEKYLQNKFVLPEQPDEYYKAAQRFSYIDMVEFAEAYKKASVETEYSSDGTPICYKCNRMWKHQERCGDECGVPETYNQLLDFEKNMYSAIATQVLSAQKCGTWTSHYAGIDRATLLVQVLQEYKRVNNFPQAAQEHTIQDIKERLIGLITGAIPMKVINDSITAVRTARSIIEAIKPYLTPPFERCGLGDITCNCKSKSDCGYL